MSLTAAELAKLDAAAADAKAARDATSRIEAALVALPGKVLDTEVGGLTDTATPRRPLRGILAILANRTGTISGKLDRVQTTVDGGPVKP